MTSEPPSTFLPHGQCFLWDPSVLWLNVSSDVIITTAYYLISAAFIYFLYKRRDVPFRWMSMLFGLFILPVARRTSCMCGPSGIRTTGEKAS